MFPGKDEKNQLEIIISVIGYPPASFLDRMPRNNLMPEINQQIHYPTESLKSLIRESTFYKMVEKCLVW